LRNIQLGEVSNRYTTANHQNYNAFASWSSVAAKGKATRKLKQALFSISHVSLLPGLQKNCCVVKK